MFRPQTEALAKRGHDVTVITTDPAFPIGGAPPNLTDIDVHELSNRLWRAEIIKAQRDTKDDDILATMDPMIRPLLKVFDSQLKEEKVHALINGKDTTFD